LLIHVSVGRWSVGVVGFIVMDVSVSAVTTALLLSVRSDLSAILGCCFSHASCELRLELATIRIRETVRPSMVGLWMEGTLVLITCALTVVTAATIVTTASIVVTITITVAVVSTVARVVAGTIVVVAGRASKVGQNLHEINEFLSGCC
jgi:hypothetical protein